MAAATDHVKRGVAISAFDGPPLQLQVLPTTGICAAWPKWACAEGITTRLAVVHEGPELQGPLAASWAGLLVLLDALAGDGVSRAAGTAR